MKYIKHLIRKYPISCFLIVLIWVACLIPVPETPLIHVTFFDKWVHIAMYLCLGAAIWTEYIRQHHLNGQEPKFSWRKILTWGWLFPVLMSGIIELAQAYCTGGTRSGDWLDFLANSTGATLMLGVGTLWVWYHAKG